MSAPRRRPPSSTDVARKAGVSQSAVSRSFTPGASVSAKTRAKVLAAAESLGYRPNALPRILLTARSNLTALIMGEITNPFYPEVLELFTRRLQDAGQHALLFALEPNQPVDDALAAVLRYRVDGVIVTSATISAQTAATCARLDVPVVLFNRHVQDAGVHSICCDNVEAGRTVANLLLDAGHRRPAFVSGTAQASTNRDREAGYRGRLAERGVWEVPADGGANSHDNGFAAALRLLRAAEPPDALFCASDIIAAGVLDAVRHELGLRVPEDVSVVGFDDVPLAGWPSFALTTVRQRRRVMVDAAVDTLLARIAGTDAGPRVRLVPGELVARRSARLPAGY